MRLLVECAFFGSAAWALASTGRGAAALVLALAAAVDTALVHAWGLDEHMRAAAQQRHRRA